MATFFGEILPVTSRAFDDDEDDEDIVQGGSSCLVLWSSEVREEVEKSPSKKLKCDSLIVAVGQAATGFIQAYVTQEAYKNVGVVTDIKDSKDQTFDQIEKSSNEKTCSIHRSKEKPQVLVCQCRTEVSPEVCFSWVEQVAGSVDLSTCTVTVLCSAMTSEYKSDVPISELSPPFIRGLKSSSYQDCLPCKVLEQPNMVTCLPAQVLTYSQIHGVKAALYVCYTESIFLDIPTMKAFKPLLKAEPLKNIAQDNSSGDKMLLKIVDQQTNQSTLYM